MGNETQVHSNLFSAEQLLTLRTHPAVQAAKANIDSMQQGSVYFTIPLSDSIKTILDTTMGLNLFEKEQIPMRWIKGDLPPHTDTGATAFDRTYLVYLTSSEGSFRIEGEEYPITEGNAYVFSEGLSHETHDTGAEPRLLLGPMSETAQPVGISAIYETGTVYLRENSGTHEYSTDQVAWNTIYWPCGAVNTDPSSGPLILEWITDMTLTSVYHYFISFSTDIQYGSRFLKPNGTRPILTIDGVLNYPGLIQNGGEFGNGNANTSVYNLDVRAVNGSTLETDPAGKAAGWVCHRFFGKGVGNNYVIHCSSDGPIPDFGGGILGSHAGSDSDGILLVVGCSSSGASANGGGGILGASAGSNLGEVTCRECWTTGVIGDFSGGIVGRNAAESSGSLGVARCYSTGIIGENGGGIVGYASGGSNGSVLISACYSTGNIASQAGGIVGADSNQTSVRNCYTTGNAGLSGGLLYGINPVSEILMNSYTTGSVSGGAGFFVGNSPAYYANCYSEAMNASLGWNSTNANQVLIGLPNPTVGTSWVDTVIGQPYEVRMGYTPYSTEMIMTGHALQSVFTQTLSKGSATSAAIVSGKSYRILQIANGIPGSYGTITIHASTGVISTTGSTEAGVYTIYVRNVGSYHITEVSLTISDEVSCCDRTTESMIAADDRVRTDVVAGNALMGSVRSRFNPLSYSDLLRMKMAYASKK